MSDYIKKLRSYVGKAPLLTIGSWLLIVNENKEVLMILRRGSKSWDFPGGTIELNETIEDASKRELKEETNLDLDELKVIDVFSGENTYRKYSNGDELYVVSVLCKVTKFHGIIKSNDGEAIDIKWFKIDELPDNLFVITQRYIDKIKKYLKEF